MLHSKIMPQKTYTELMEENIGKIPIYSNEWTNYNPSDPGITILENIAGAQIIQQNQMDEPSDAVRAKLLKLLGYVPEKGKSAKVYLEPCNNKERIHILADQRFIVGDMCFETNREIEMVDSHIIGIYSLYQGVYTDLSYVLDRNMSMVANLFGKKPEAGAQLYIVMDKPLLPKECGILHVDVVSDYGRNPFPPEQREVFAQLEWECYCETGFVKMEVDDGSVGFLMDGELVFTQPEETAAIWEEGPINGYVYRATLSKSEYDVAPSVAYISGFLFPVVQKETLAMTYGFAKKSEVEVCCNWLEEAYVTVFAKEQKGSSYRKYEQCVEANYSQVPTGRYYKKEQIEKNQMTVIFDKETFGYAPAHVKNPVKVVLYNEEIMQKYYLGEIYGYDNQEIKLPVGHVVTETFCVIARRDDGEGGYLYDFLKPNRMDEKKMSYYLYENEGKIVIQDPGEYVGATLFIGAVAVIRGEEGNVRRGNRFICQELDMQFVNPAKGEGGRFQESLEDVRRRLVADLNQPQTAVLVEDYETLVKNTPGLCIAKANAWRDDDRNEIQVVVMPKLEQDFPKMSNVYIELIERFLEERRLLSTAIRVLQPQYIAVNVRGKIYVKPHFDNCEEIAQQTVAKELDYITGNQKFGEPLRFDKVFHALDALECVSYVYEMNMEPASMEYVRMEGADIIPEKKCLLYPGRIQLEILPVAKV